MLRHPVALPRKSRGGSSAPPCRVPHHRHADRKSRAPARIHWVARQAGSFTVHLTQAVSSATSFTYLIVEPFDGLDCLSGSQSIGALGGVLW